MSRITWIIVLITLFSPGTNNSMAQWVQTGGPEGGYVGSIIEDDMYYFAATRGPIHRMKKNDSIWTPHLESLTWALSANTLANIGTTVFAGGSFGVYHSLDHGVIFQGYGSGLHNVGSVFSFAVKGKDLFAGTGSGVYLSTDNGVNWSPVNSGLDSSPVSCILVIDSSLFAGTWGSGVYYSDDYGTNWTSVDSGMTANHINSLAVLDSAIYAGTWWGDAIYRLSDDGKTWDTVNYDPPLIDVNTLAAIDTIFFAGTHGGIGISRDRGNNWKHLDSGPQDAVQCFHVSDSVIFAGTHTGIYVSPDTSKSWSREVTGLIATEINVLVQKDSLLFAGTGSSGLFRSNDEGATWVRTLTHSFNAPITSLLFNDQYIYSGSTHGVYRSSDCGDTWISVNLGLPDVRWITALAASGSNLFAGIQSEGVFLSTDGGASWIPVNSGLTDKAVVCLAFSDTNLFAGTETGAFISSSYGSSWTPIDDEQISMGVNGFAHNDEFFFALTPDSGLFRSADDGATWVKTNMPGAMSLAASGTNIFTGSDWGSVNHSSNHGATWTTFNQGLIRYPVMALGLSDTNLFAGMRGSGVWRLPFSEMDSSDGFDFAYNYSACTGDPIPALVATGDSIKWYSDPDLTDLLFSGNTYETGQTEPGTYTYYVTQLINSLILKDTASLIISSIPAINSIEKTNKTTCINDDATITINATDDNPLVFSIDGGKNYFDNGGSFSALSNGIYNVAVKNSNNCKTSGGMVEIISEGILPPVPIASEDTTYCYGDEIKDLYAIASSGGTITWYSDPGLTLEIESGTSFDPGDLQATTSFFVTETSNGCESPANEVIIGIRKTAPYTDEQICMVTIDLNTGKNLVVWEKTPDVGTQYFNIYREGSLIGKKSFDELSIIKDTLVNPETRPYLYYITTVDSCGNESSLSPYHKPLFLQYVSSQDGVNLRWSNYVIEGEPVTFDSYTIYRGGDSINLVPLAENIPTAVDVYTDNEATALINRYFYRVAGVLTTPCSPSGAEKTGTGPYQHTLSNMDDNKLKTEINELYTDNELIIYPNPAKDIIRIKFSNPDHENYQFILSDLTGKMLMFRDKISEDQLEFNRNALPGGLYLIELKGPRNYRSKILIE